MEPQRPKPDDLLQRIRAGEEMEKRAKLKIFFGASAGVGKTYAMLVEAHERRRAGTDVVVGVVETHGRGETAALLEGLDSLPKRATEYRGSTLQEFDLDAALARKPGLLLLDELAHTNVPGSRHAKRWQDVEELLEAGIDVYTTLNVQHVESLYDLVAQITGVPQRETVPDSILDRADEIELVDLPPDDLLQRLREGKVYLPEQAGRAADHFFRKSNLIALRELALRTTAERVDAQMESYHHREGITRRSPVGGRIIVGIGEPGGAPRLIRAARRMAAALKAEWIVVHVERPGRPAPEALRARLVDVLTFAEELGAETAILSGFDVADELLAYARTRNASRVLVGRPRRPAWRERVLGSVVGTLIRRSGDLDLYVIRGEDGSREPARPAAPAPRAIGWSMYARTAGVVAACTGAAALMHSAFERSNLIMVYLLGVVWVAATLGRGPAIFAAVLSVALFDFFFVPPHLTFAVSDTQYLVTFAVMLLVAVVIGTLAARLRGQLIVAREDERRSAALSRLSGEMAALQGQEAILASLVRHLADMFAARAVVLLPRAKGGLEVSAGDASLLGDKEHERGVAQWSFDSGQPAGLGTATLPGSQCLYLPLRGTRGELGVLGLRPAEIRRLLAPDSWRLLESSVNQAALALERSQLAVNAEHARVRAEAEQMRNALLSSVSHDLRTPLAAITGAASNLLDGHLAEDQRREMARTIAEEAARLNRLIANLLQMTRLEAGAVEVQHAWHSLEEIVGAALQRAEPLLEGRPVETRIPGDLPLVLVDDLLIEQVVFNLLENAAKHTDPGRPVTICARRREGDVEVEVADRGPGLPPGEEEQVFVRFHRGGTRHAAGVGLGLAICRGIVEAHGGTIRAENRRGGGATFTFVLPIGGEAPAIEPEAEAAGDPRPPESR